MSVSNTSVSFGLWPSANPHLVEPLAWQVLEQREDGSKLIITRDIIEQWPLRDIFDASTSGQGAVADWLNGPFAQLAFTAEQRACIKGELRLLSADEAARYFEDDAARAARGSAYALQRGADDWWWLGSAGGRADHAACVLPSGHIGVYGSPRQCTNGVRPVLLLAPEPTQTFVPKQRVCAIAGMALRYGQAQRCAEILGTRALDDDALRLGLTGGYVGQQAFAQLLDNAHMSPQQVEALWRCAKPHRAAVQAIVGNVDLEAFAQKEDLM